MAWVVREWIKNRAGMKRKGFKKKKKRISDRKEQENEKRWK